MKTAYKFLLFAVFFISINLQATTYTLDQQSGSFSKQYNNYTNDMSEIWNINTGIPSAVKITYTLDSESDYDFLTIYSIDNNGNATVVLSLSGYYSGTVTTTLPTGKARVVFTSDGSCCYADGDGFLGFSASFSVDNSYYISQDLNVNGKSTLTGNVGIGKSSSNYKLDVLGDIQLSGKLGVGLSDQAYYDSKYFGNYSLNWCMDSWTTIGPTLWQSAWGGMKFFTTGVPRMAIASTGYIGIGTTTPKAKLEVLTGVNATPATTGTNQAGAALRLRGGDNAVLDFGMNSVNTWIQAGDQTALNANYNISLNPNGGNVGIGVASPQTELHVNGEIRSILKNISNFRMIGGNYASMIRNDGGNTFFLLTNSGDINGGWNALRPLRIENSTGNLFFADSKFQIMHNNGYIYASGKIGIGLTDPNYTLSQTPATELLTVNGTIHAKEVNVSLDNLADYVFDSNYKLMPLSEVEQFVNTNKHLPSIPSATEVQTNGLNMGDMQNKMLQKIEELTLYMIEQQKTIADQQRQINELKEQVKK